MAGLRRICRHLIWIAFQTSFKCGLGLIRNYYSHLALPCLSMLIIYVVTDRKLWLVVQRQSPQVQYQQAMVLVLNNVQKSGFVEHYDTTVKFTFDLLDLESSLHHCNLEICVKLCHKELWSPLTTKFSSVHPWVQMDIYDKSEEITSRHSWYHVHKKVRTDRWTTHNASDHGRLPAQVHKNCISCCFFCCPDILKSIWKCQKMHISLNEATDTPLFN